ncbi:MAG: hypothetical protein WCD81_08595 [Candidatus Bathyarchaeia archaeon]
MIETSPLPNVEPCCWEIDRAHGTLFYVDEGVEYRVIKSTIIANGTHDLCVAVKDDGSPTIRKLCETPKNKVMMTSKYDFLWVKFEKPVRGTQWCLITEITPDVKRMLDLVMPFMKTEMKGDLFDMYARDVYAVKT